MRLATPYRKPRTIREGITQELSRNGKNALEIINALKRLEWVTGNPEFLDVRMRPAMRKALRLYVQIALNSYPATSFARS